MIIIHGRASLTEDRQTTQDRLLDAAESLFAERAFENVSIRELAAAADVNVAAVNYHFQGKENLFHEVILRRFVAQRDRTLAALDGLLEETGGRPRVDQVIRTLVRQYLEGALPGPGNASFMALIARQMHPGNAHMAGPFFKTMVAPVFGGVFPGSHRRPARPGTGTGDLDHRQHRRARSTTSSSAGRNGRTWKPDPESLAIMLQAFPALGSPCDEYIEQVTEHITRFSTAAIDGLYPEVLHDDPVPGASWLFSCCCAGCSVGPDYVRPELEAEVPDEWAGQTPEPAVDHGRVIWPRLPAAHAGGQLALVGVLRRHHPERPGRRRPGIQQRPGRRGRPGARSAGPAGRRQVGPVAHHRDRRHRRPQQAQRSS